MRETRYGVGFHWTGRNVQKDGTRKEHRRAVDEFNVDRFAQQVLETGAGHILFTVNHGDHSLCCPNPVLDGMVPGFTHERDLPMELMDELGKHGIKVALYFNHGLHPGAYKREPEWGRAFGYDNTDSSETFRKLSDVLAWMGDHYGGKLLAWWLDGGYELNWLARGKSGGQYDTVDRYIESNVPWQEITRALKRGNPDRLVAYNNGVETKVNLTEYQDFYAGEICRLNYIPRTPLAPGDLPWYSFASWHADSRAGGGSWVMNEYAQKLPWYPPPAEYICTCIKNFHNVGGVPCFNLFIYQDGAIFEQDLAAMRGVKEICSQS